MRILYGLIQIEFRDYVIEMPMNHKMASINVLVLVIWTFLSAIVVNCQDFFIIHFIMLKSADFR